jgi:hypothetical protein
MSVRGGRNPTRPDATVAAAPRAMRADELHIKVAGAMGWRRVLVDHVMLNEFRSLAQKAIR